jgi:hypothetical protein
VRKAKKKNPSEGKKLLHPTVRDILDVPDSVDDKTFLKEWRTASRKVCKPCWELRYCPYGPLVEQFPLLPPTRSQAIEHNDYLRACLKSGKISDGKPLDARRRKMFESQVSNFSPDNYPAEIPRDIAAMSCSVFGHICPVVFVNEGFTETSESRRSGRYIAFKTKVRVVRRDNYTCQHCGKHLLDNEVEFDHRIPLSRGGSSDEHNLRLTCHDCNHDKSDRVEI